MKTLRSIILLLALVAFAFEIAAAQNWSTIYQTDFSSDPFLNGWTTNNSERYYWDSGSQTLFTDNYTNSGDWATRDLSYNGESFRLTFDVMPVRGPWETGDIDIGLFGPTRYSNGPSNEERLYVMFGGYDQPGVGAIYIDTYNSGGEHFWSGPGAGLMLNGAWHHVEVTYDSEAMALSLEVTRDNNPVLSWQTTMNYGFSSDLQYLGASMAGEWVTSDRHETAYIDNMTFAIDDTQVCWDMVYETDFSSDPLWTNNNPDYFYWEPSGETYRANQYNVNGGGYYAYHCVGFDGGSFLLSFDYLVDYSEYASGLHFGLFDTDLDTEKPSFMHFYFSNDDQGMTEHVSWIDLDGAGHASEYGIDWVLNTWYHVVIEYDSDAQTLSVDVDIRDTGEDFVSLNGSGVGPFSQYMYFLGSSNYRPNGTFQVPGAHTSGRFDNIAFYARQGCSLSVDIDIKPGSCPNPLNVKEKGIIPVAVLGSVDFDVLDIDFSTVLLEGVSPIARLHLPEDIAAPVPDPQDECDCGILGPDGFSDRVFHFDAQQIVAALGEVEDGDEISLSLTGRLMDGTEFVGSDCVLILENHKPRFGPRPEPYINPIPDHFELAQNYPNPFNAQTTINFSLPEASHVMVEVYDLLGQSVTKLVDADLQAGYHDITWDAGDQASGMYFYKIQAGEFTETKKMLLLK